MDLFEQDFGRFDIPVLLDEFLALPAASAIVA